MAAVGVVTPLTIGRERRPSAPRRRVVPQREPALQPRDHHVELRLDGIRARQAGHEEHVVERRADVVRVTAIATGSSASGPSAARKRRTSPSSEASAAPAQAVASSLSRCRTDHHGSPRSKNATNANATRSTRDASEGSPSTIEGWAAAGRPASLPRPRRRAPPGSRSGSGRSPGPRRQRWPPPWSWCPHIPPCDTARPPRR